MKTRSMILAGLGLATAAAILYLRTENGKKLRNGLADNLKGWRDKLTQLTDGEESEEGNKRISKQLKHT